MGGGPTQGSPWWTTRRTREGLFIFLAPPAKPLAHLSSRLVERLPQVVERAGEPLGVVSERVAGLRPRAQRVVARDVGAPHDAVIGTGPDPRHQLVDPLH